MSDPITNQEQIYPAPKVLAAINAVQKALKAGIPKGQKNTMQGYNFRGIDDILNVVGPLLPTHGLVVFPRYISREMTAHKNAKGNTMFHVVVKAEFRFVSAADGSFETVEMFGEAMDSSDKATGKAQTAAYKQACVQTFAIPVEGEPDADADSPTVPPDEPPSKPLPKVVANKPSFEKSAAELEDERIMQRYLDSKHEKDNPDS